MININEILESHVIPQWLKLDRSISTGELSYKKVKKNMNVDLKGIAINKIKNDYTDFRLNPNIYFATDLIGNAFALLKKNDIK